MSTMPYHFDELLGRIEPDQEREDIAQEIPDQVRDFLKESEEITTVNPHSRLAGSYARNTAIKNIKDVDVILVVHDDYMKEEPERVLNLLFSVLQGLPDALDDHGEVVACRHQRRSVQVHLEHKNFDLDIVPAVAPNGVARALEIPDKDWEKWVPTHPLGYGDELSALNSKHQDKVVRLIKLLKHWRDVHLIYRRPKSYWLECLIYHKIACGNVPTDGLAYAEIFRDLLGSIRDGFQDNLKREKVPEISDPMLGNNVAHNWELDDFKAFMSRVDESYGWAKRALDTDVSESDSIKLWQKVFGKDWFPTEVTQQKGENLRAAISKGSIFVTPDGRVHTETPSVRSVPAPAQRFYGKD